MDLLMNCILCPRKCGVNRYKKTGFCGVGVNVKVARAALHYMEEPCISGTKRRNLPTNEKNRLQHDDFRYGSGTVFFSGCNLKCCYCQNFQLSHENFGKEITTLRLSEIFLELQEKGACNINLVTAVMYIPQIIEALKLVKSRLKIPVVYNSGGYERKDIIRMLKDYVDIYLVDLKYYQNEKAMKYSKAPDYFRYAMDAIEEMIYQTGKPVFAQGKTMDDEDAVMQSGVIIRHLVIPGMRKDSIEILKRISERFDKEYYILSLMSQFTPYYHCSEFKEINRKVTGFEYDSVVDEALRLGLDNTYIQGRNSAGKEYTPEFNLEGI
ncbi:MAG: radical SAM protein [Lachnospiraceae bacterium]|nr:radical SAM protein [Lachnospiraceae bacterium]